MCTIHTENLFIRKCTEYDSRYNEMMYGQDNNILSKKHDNDLFKKVYNEVYGKHGLEVFLIFKKETKEFCGQLELRGLSDGGKELGIALIRECQNKGIGTEAIKGFTNWLHETRNYSELAVKINATNKRSQHVFEKLGAIFLCQKSTLPPEFVEKLKNIDSDFVESEIRYYKLPLPINLSKRDVK